jgi:malonyl CoA-acyl carrier protein transacylase
MIAFLFPGQGSQFRGMGQGLFDEVRQFAMIEKDVDAILGYSLRKLCLEDEGNRLKQTQFTQPCLYVINALHYYSAIQRGVKPTYLAGHSLGEYNALMAAGVFDFLTGLRMVKKRGELMSKTKNGSLAAVTGIEIGKITGLVKENGLESLDVANYNSATQTIVSGPVDDIDRAGPIFEKAGAFYVPLPVSAAFHSRYMADVAKTFAAFLAPMSFEAPKIPVVSNVTGQPYPGGNPSESVKSLLVQQIDHSVQWNQNMRWLINQGVTDFTEIGPGNVLTRLIQQIQRQKDS